MNAKEHKRQQSFGEHKSVYNIRTQKCCFVLQLEKSTTSTKKHVQKTRNQ